MPTSRQPACVTSRCSAPAATIAHCGEDAAAALEAAKAGGFRLVFVVQTTPEWDAVEILHQIKSADSTIRVVIVSCQAAVEAAVAAMREGAADYLREPCSAEELRSALQRLEQLAAGLWPAAGPDDPPHEPRCFEGMLGQCAAMREVFALIERIAPADSTVLVTGESGTGKEMVVRAIHQHSRRRDNPLLGCDCTALAPTLLESELFGHVKGSFSGAIATKKGLFEVAHQGTLLLDEVANLSMETQGKLLRVLETQADPQGGRHGRARSRHPPDRHHQPQLGEKWSRSARSAPISTTA